MSAVGVVEFIAAAFAVVAGLGWVARKLWAIARTVGRLGDELLGEPARGDQAARPGLAARVTHLEVQSQTTNARLDDLARAVRGAQL